MTKYELVKDKLSQKLNYYSEKTRECKDLIEFYHAWFTVESSEVISKSDLQYSDKKKLFFCVWGKESIIWAL